jgi:hypothetical protein
LGGFRAKHADSFVGVRSDKWCSFDYAGSAPSGARLIRNFLSNFPLVYCAGVALALHNLSDFCVVAANHHAAIAI